MDFYFILLDQGCFLFRHPFYYTYSLQAFTQWQDQAVVDGHDFLKTKSTNTIMASYFFNLVFFLRVPLSETNLC